LRIGVPCFFIRGGGTSFFLLYLSSFWLPLGGSLFVLVIYLCFVRGFIRRGGPLRGV
jgi:hypothetical protein